MGPKITNVISVTVSLAILYPHFSAAKGILLCLIGVYGEHTWVSAGNSERRERDWLLESLEIIEGLGECFVGEDTLNIEVCESVSQLALLHVH